jgi:transposase/very-short-patch-repair endonuclease
MSHKKEIPSKSEIESLYAREGTTISSLARHYGTSNPTVRKWLMLYEIDRKDQKQASIEANNRHRSRVKPDKHVLIKLYENSTIESLAKHFSVGLPTIYEWLEDYDIQKRTLSESTKLGKERQYQDIQFSYEELDSRYDRTKSIDILAKDMNVSRTHIRNQLRKNGIKIEPIEPSWRSSAEISLYEFLVEHFPHDNWSHSDKTIIGPYEIDIVNHDKKIAIEYGGLYWHSEVSSGKKQDYHRSKYLKCKNAGYKLITIFETDDDIKIKSLLLKLLGKTTKIGARKTTICCLSSTEAMKFHREHHLHGSVGASNHYGLLYDDEIVMVASFGKNRFGKTFQYECARISSHSNFTVVGGVSRLIKHFIEKENPKSIVTFADLRFGDGNVYEKCGFEYAEDTAPNYWYSKKYCAPLYSRVKFQKHKLKNQLELFDITKTEFENMIDNGWDRIWDCGNAKYIWENKKRRE